MFNWHVSRSEVTHKYGYHLLFPHVLVTAETHKAFIHALTRDLKAEEDTLRAQSDIVKEILTSNTWVCITRDSTWLKAV